MRNLVVIMALIATLIAGVNSASSAEVPFISSQTSILTDDFCGTTPPASISCPKTGLNICECYLSPDQDIAEFSPLDHPPLQTIRIKVKPKLIALLPELDALQIHPIVLERSLERPPQ